MVLWSYFSVLWFLFIRSLCFGLMALSQWFKSRQKRTSPHKCLQTAMLFAVVYKMPGVGMLKTNFNNLFFIFFTFFHRWCVVVILLLCMKLASLRLVTFPFYLFWVQFLFGLKLFLHATNVLCFGLRKAILLTYLGFHPSIHPSMLPPYYLFHRIPSQVRNVIPS